ncbi:bZIP transcription factor TGA10-like isoform X2 [Hevea brasiliensis]|uniref:bZIP transcription factor TGA10-like isoform X2 n=1 Tax=Hevea brasiliensis TaxID=3981 RepID=UPI000B7785C4|nr:bZIP transcription factor TGA10-like isoform X2 [Hevea brasiliensis]
MPLMGFSRVFGGQVLEEEEEQLEAKLLQSPFMATNKVINHSTQLEEQQQNQHHHHHHQHPQQQQQEQHLQIQENHHHQQTPYGMMQSSSSSSIPGTFISKDAGAYDLGDLDQALFLYLDGQDPSTVQDQRQSSGMRPPTLNIFPSQPMHVEPSSAKANTPGLVSPITSGSKRPSEPTVELANARNDAASGPEPAKAIKVARLGREGNRKGPTTSSSEQEGPKTPDPKTLRRLAQNREAARKSRLRKKAYVQQLESSRIRLTQLEQELQRARAQGLFFGGGGLLGGDQGLPVGISNISSDAAVFDIEYTRWLEEHHRLTCELRAAVQEHLPENELRLFVDNCLAHYDEVMSLKGMVAKSDVFHLVSGMWKTPAERCFMWMGDFRPSDLIKIILNQIEPLTEQQILGICGLQQSTQEAEEALSQGLEALNQSLSDTIASDSLSCPPNMGNYMGQMAVAMNKLSTLEGFVRQADNLRHQTLHRLHQILTTRQAARCFLAIAEYFHRLRALSSLWLARPRQE